MILLIDNYDSFTYNLVHLIEGLGAETRVVRNDVLSPGEIFALDPKAIVLSPGPGAPRQAGVCLDLIRALPERLPLLGVCLGHQAIGEALGGEVIAAADIMHGKVSQLTHGASGLFAGVPSPFTATRYHSLAVRRDTLPAALRVDAETADGEIMALSHVSRPIFGVQFHPESIASEHGATLLGNFLTLAGAQR